MSNEDVPMVAAQFGQWPRNSVDLSAVRLECMRLASRSFEVSMLTLLARISRRPTGGLGGRAGGVVRGRQTITERARGSSRPGVMHGVDWSPTLAQKYRKTMAIPTA